jgi:hypothetical protein
MYDNVTGREQIKISSDGRGGITKDVSNDLLFFFFYSTYWKKERQVTCALYLMREREDGLLTTSSRL